MDSPEQPHSPNTGKWITVIIWLMGIALQLARKWLCTVFNLNTEWFMMSIMGPLWSFMLVCLLAGFLRAFRRPAEKWSGFWRMVFAFAAALLLSVPQIDLIMALREGWHFSYLIGTMRLVFPLYTALVFSLVPGAIVVLFWLRHNRPVSTLRALGLALLVHGLVYVPYGLWVNQLIIKYSQP